MATPRGRRLADGALVDEAPTGRSTYAVLAVLLLGVLRLTRPTTESFVTHLEYLSTHPSGMLGSLTSLASALHISVAADTESFVFVRIGRFRGERFMGVLGTWVQLGGIGTSLSGGAFPSAPSLATSARSYLCASGYSPCELLVMLTLVVHLLFRVYPRAMMRHCVCSLRAVQECRVWVLLTSAVSHASLLHLVHNCIHLLQVQPLANAALGCDNLLTLMFAAALVSSAASIAWHGILGNRPRDGSLGASGVVMALVAANAALFPHTPVLVYGIQMTAAQSVLFYLVLDVATQHSGLGGGGGIDASAHIGGAACGWLLAHRWRRMALGGFGGAY